MQVITFQSEVFQELKDQLKEIAEKLNKEEKKHPLTETWLDNQDVCELLHISKRTLQHYRDSNKLAFSKIGAKIYYKASDVEFFLNDNYSGESKETA